MKCQCLCSDDGSEIIQFKLDQDERIIIQANKSNSQINICKIPGDQQYQCFNSQSGDSFINNNSLAQLMDKIQNLDKNTIHQMIEISTKSQNHVINYLIKFHKMPYQEDPCCKILSANLLRCNCSCSSSTPTEFKKPKKQKQKPKQSPKKEVVIVKASDSSDLKVTQKQSKVQQQVNEDIKNFEDRIKTYTSEIDDAKKIIPNLPQDWIKRIGTQKKKK